MIIARNSRSDADRVTLDQLLQHNAQRAPDQIALADAPNRTDWSEGTPRRLTWRAVETAVNAVALRLAAFGMPTDSVVAVQAGTAADTVVAILACLRANLLPAMMPPTWRNAEITTAIQRTSAKAIIADTRLGPDRPAERLREVAAANFSIRFLCSLGGDPPDGVIGLDECFLDSAAEPPPRAPRFGNAAEHVAIITFDAGAEGWFPVARSHNEWLTAGLAVLAELRLDRDSALLSPMALSSLGGLASGLVPWLMSGCRLCLHQAFDRKTLTAQLRDEGITHIVLPSAVASAALTARLFEGTRVERLATIGRFGAVPIVAEGPTPALSPIVTLGEIGLVAGVRDARQLPAGIIRAPLGLEEGVAVLELAVREGLLCARGAMTPQAPLFGREAGGRYPVEADAFVATGYAASLEAGSIRGGGPRQEVISIGGQGLPVPTLEAIYADAPGVLSVGVRRVENPLLGERFEIEAMPASEGSTGAVALAMHAEGKGVTPLAQSSETKIGDRRRGTALAGAA